MRARAGRKIKHFYFDSLLKHKDTISVSCSGAPVHDQYTIYICIIRIHIAIYRYTIYDNLKSSKFGRVCTCARRGKKANISHGIVCMFIFYFSRFFYIISSVIKLVGWLRLVVFSFACVWIKKKIQIKSVNFILRSIYAFSMRITFRSYRSIHLYITRCVRVFVICQFLFEISRFTRRATNLEHSQNRKNVMRQRKFNDIISLRVCMYVAILLGFPIEISERVNERYPQSCELI